MMMDEYQRNARSTANLDGHEVVQLSTLTLGLAGESGEFLALAMTLAVKSSLHADYIKKVIGHNHPVDRERIVKELGDILWYVSMEADFFDIPLSEIADTNSKKLAARYPNGFESEKSINRQD